MCLQAQYFNNLQLASPVTAAKQPGSLVNEAGSTHLYPLVLNFNWEFMRYWAESAGGDLINTTLTT